MAENIFQITSQEVTVEVTDERTGQVFRRTLPIDYFETANGIILRGENLDGTFSQLVFYSGRGVERLQDLTGHGADADPCGTHS